MDENSPILYAQAAEYKRQTGEDPPGLSSVLDRNIKEINLEFWPLLRERTKLETKLPELEAAVGRAHMAEVFSPRDTPACSLECNVARVALQNANRRLQYLRVRCRELTNEAATREL